MTKVKEECDSHIHNVQAVDVKDELSAANTDSFGNMCTSHSTTQLSSCNDHVSVDSSGHQRSHTVDSYVTCTVCGKSLHRGSIKRHMRIHAAERPYSCDEYDKTVTHSNTLKDHTRRRTCSVCNKQFASSFSLKRHLRIHSGLHPYCCEVCQKKFTYSANLTVHMRTHSDEQPYTSKLCFKKFTHSANLTVHMRTHTGEQPYWCHLCRKNFAYLSHLKRHITGSAVEKKERINRKTGNSTPCKIVTPENFSSKVCTCDYVGDGNYYAHFCENRFSGVSPQIGEI